MEQYENETHGRASMEMFHQFSCCSLWQCYRMPVHDKVQICMSKVAEVHEFELTHSSSEFLISPSKVNSCTQFIETLIYAQTIAWTYRRQWGLCLNCMHLALHPGWCIKKKRGHCSDLVTSHYVPVLGGSNFVGCTVKPCLTKTDNSESPNCFSIDSWDFQNCPFSLSGAS